jgi:zinc resistance-associated protein
MLKTVLAGTTALVIAGSSLAIAQSGPRADTSRGQPSAADISAMADARVARIKARLRLTAEQEKHWPAVEAAIRDLAQERATRMHERRTAREAAGGAQPDAIERMRRGADAMTTRAASLKKLADATEPLFKSLDDSQKQQLAMLLRAPGAFAMGERHAAGPRVSDGRRFRDGQRFSHRGHRGHHGRDAR